MEYLDCSGNDLKELDIQRLQKLTTLDCTDNANLAKIYVWFNFVAPDGFTKPETAEYVEPSIAAPEGYELVWHDEFDTAGVSSPSTDNWWYETGDGGWGNNELQDYVSGGKYNGVRIAEVSDGTLKITAQKIDGKVRSVRMNTVQGWTYGYFEGRLKLCKGKGTWPAFWMMGNDFKSKGWPNCGETDILEMGHQNGIKKGAQEKFLNGACHWGAPGHQYYSYDFTNSYSVQDGQFHTFTCIWDENQIAMYIDLDTKPDAKPYFKMALKDFGDNEFRKDNFILLNLAVGGNFPGIWDINQITALNDGPAEMEIDYVRVFQKK